MAVVLRFFQCSVSLLPAMFGRSFFTGETIGNHLAQSVAYSTHRKKLPIDLRAVFLYTQDVNKKRKFPTRYQEE